VGSAKSWGAIVNCIGTALYLSGENRNDSYVSPYDAQKFLKRLKKLTTPVEGCLVEWRTTRNDEKGRPQTYSFHMGVITQVHPFLLITDRVGYRHAILENQNFVEVNSYWSEHYKDTPKPEVNYYLPRNLVVPENLLRI
jgi:hypothetical protein